MKEWMTWEWDEMMMRGWDEIGSEEMDGMRRKG